MISEPQARFLKAWKDPKGLLQVILGPRQIGKTTFITNLINADSHTIYASADHPQAIPTRDFILTHWEKARAIDSSKRTLVLDEIQKISQWSDVVKGLWDEDKKNKLKIRVCLLGSSSITIGKGLSETMMGRFEVHHFPHWSYGECSSTFKSTLSEFTEFGGYPKAYSFRKDLERWENYLTHTIFEPTLGRRFYRLKK